MRDKNSFIQTFRRIQKGFPRFYAHLLSRLDLTLPQYALLNLLDESGEMLMSEASRKLWVSKPAVTHLVDHLEKKRCLKRCPDARDRRVFILRMTPLGKKHVQKIEAKIFSFLFIALKGFSSAEQGIVQRFYGALGGELEKEVGRLERSTS